jgi:low affinity Fe/Cu permease
MANGKRQSLRVERFRRGKIRPGRMRVAFTRLASRTATLAGHHWAFVTASALIVAWLATGPFFGWSDTWQLYANTFTTLVTFVMVFLIQNTQNRDSKAIHLKLDELIRAIPAARNEFMEAEEEDLDEILREKKIVDRDDPAPPGDREEHRGHTHHEERKAS